MPLLLLGDTLRFATSVQQRGHQPDAGDTISEAMVYASDESGTILTQPLHERQIPERTPTIHD